MFKGIDLSSDTATKPSQAMKEYMFRAELGDEQKGEDPSTLQLETLAAQLFGFDSALFLPSATMANQIAIRTLSNPGEVLLAAENAHIFLAECGGPAIHSQVLSRPIPTATGIFTKEDIKQHCYWRIGVHHPIVGLLSVENTSNLGGGHAWSKSALTAVTQHARELGIKTHMDGSRVFNACIKTNLSPKEISEGFDMVTVCLSKGLGCAVGALLLFNKPFYQKVRRYKQLMGGAMRQSGILAAGGIFAFEHHIKRLAVDHEHATFFAQEMGKFKNKIKIVNDPPETNMVFFEWVDTKSSTQQFLTKCIENGLRFSQVGENKFRAVMHLDISRQDLIDAINIVNSICPHH